MKKFLSLPIDIESPISVTEDDILDAEKIENNPEKMLQLIDLIFLGYNKEEIYS